MGAQKDVIMSGILKIPLKSKHLIQKALHICSNIYIVKGLYYGSFGYYSEAVKEEFDDEYYSEEIFQTLNNMSIKRIHGLFNCMLLEVMTRPSKYENR